MPVHQEAIASRRVTVDRSCGSCRARWTYSFTLTGSSSRIGFGGGEAELSRDAERRLEWAVATSEDRIRGGVLCPVCGGLANELVAASFGNGYRDGLEREVRARSRGVRVGALVTTPLLGAGLLCLLFVPAVREFEDYKVLQLAWLFGLLVTGVFWAAVLRARGIQERLRVLGEDEARAWVVRVAEASRVLCPGKDPVLEHGEERLENTGSWPSFAVVDALHGSRAR